MAIQRLDDRVIAQIAAGEVIERPASVVKELIENALDANASDIYVQAMSGGRQLIRVSDNGDGIRAEEVSLSLTRHATSKLRTVDDLQSIRTLGFRGEALASIVSVSQLTLVTRHHEEDAGTQVRVAGGDVTSNRSVGAARGTVLTIENLFFNTPARLKFLKSDSTERRHITSVVMNYALAYPDVAFTLEQDGRETIRTNGTGMLEDAMVSIFGVGEFKQMVPVSSDEERRTICRVAGFTSAPDFNRGDRTRILLFVNGRAVQDSKITYAVIQAYHTFMINGRYPVAVLMLDVDPSEVDVNVHPAKAEVRFRDPNSIFSAVQRSVRKAVVTHAAPAARMRPNVFSRAEIHEHEVNTNLGVVESGTQLPIGLDMQDAGQHARQRDLYLSSRAEWDVPFTSQSNPDNYIDDSTQFPNGPDGPERPRTLPLLRVIGQVSASYIVAEGPAGMYLVDQHAAHERILYEQYMTA
ncbi:MAG: DNA mismatch repair endonuclease MutL, partial [Chloroflexota bacterium]